MGNNSPGRDFEGHLMTSIFLGVQGLRKSKILFYLKKRNITIVEYEAKFTVLDKFIQRFVEDEHDHVHKFEMGLRTKIRKQVVPYELTIYADVVNKTLIIEREVNNECAEKERN